MYDKLIDQVYEQVTAGVPTGLAIFKAAQAGGVPPFKLAREMRARSAAKLAAKRARENYRKTVPNRMVENFEKR